MASAASSYIKTVAAVDTRTLDRLRFPFNARPQAMSVYVRFVEMGTVNIAGGMVWSIDAAGVAPRIDVEASGAGVYTVAFFNPTGFTSGGVAAGTFGQMTELLATLSATGVTQLSISINGGAITTGTASAAATMPQVWGTGTNVTFSLNSFGSGFDGFAAFTHAEIVARVKTMQQMRVLAGTD